MPYCRWALEDGMSCVRLRVQHGPRSVGARALQCGAAFGLVAGPVFKTGVGG